MKHAPFRFTVIGLMVLLITAALALYLWQVLLPKPTADSLPTETVTLPTAPTTVTDPADAPAEPTDAPTEPTVAPTEPEPADADFVLVDSYVPNIRVELKYATTDNFTGQVIYDFTACYLRYGTAKKLTAAAQLLEELGYGLVIWDGYRPVSAQQKLWDVYPDPNYVSPPGTGKQTHCRGIAVDVTLYDLTTGQHVKMPTEFDHFSPLADRDYSDCGEDAAANALLLEEILSSCGFQPYFGEWWHFSDTVEYPVELEFEPEVRIW